MCEGGTEHWASSSNGNLIFIGGVKTRLPRSVCESIYLNSYTASPVASGLPRHSHVVLLQRFPSLFPAFLPSLCNISG